MSHICRSPEVDGDVGFQREGFGRQSMSEKRRGHVDPKISELYQKIKTRRSERPHSQYSSGKTDSMKLYRTRTCSLQFVVHLELFCCVIHWYMYLKAIFQCYLLSFI